MKTFTGIEVPVHYRVVRVRRLNPFHWALLRTLQVMGAGRRPGLDELAQRLCLGEPAFLHEAWRELLGWHAVDDADLSQARLSLEGEDGLRLGFVPLGPSVERTRVIRFTLGGEWLASDLGGTASETKRLVVLPEWSRAITALGVEQHLRGASPGEVGADEEWQGLRLDWENARAVTWTMPSFREGI